MDGYDDAKGPPRPEVQRMVGNAWSITARAIYTADNECTEVFMSMNVKSGFISICYRQPDLHNDRLIAVQCPRHCAISHVEQLLCIIVQLDNPELILPLVSEAGLPVQLVDVLTPADKLYPPTLAKRTFDHDHETL